MKVEDITRVSLTPRWSAEQKGHLTVGNGLLCKIIEDNDGMLAVVAEPLAHGAAGERSYVLQRGSFGGCSGDDDAVLHGVVLFKCLDKLGHSRSLLSNCNIDAVELLGFIVTAIPPLLVQHSIKRNRSLASLTVSNDQFSLSTPNRHHCIYSLEAGLYRLVDGSAGKNTRGFELR